MKSMMTFLKKHYEKIAESALLIFVFFYSQLPLRDFDIWFHLKGGEIIAKTGRIPTTELFSHAAQGREWIVHEWLFELTAYFLSTIGMWTLPIFISCFVILTLYCMLRILKDIFQVNLVTRLTVVFIFFVSVYEFHTARSHPIAYSLLTLELFLNLLFLFKGKKYLYWTPLITLIWLNFHSSAFISWGLQFAFFCVLMLQWILTKKKMLLTQAKIMGILSVVNFLVTLTPPMGITDYKLLWTFYQYRDFLGKFIAEWAPTALQDNVVGYVTFSIIFSITTISLLFIAFKEKTWTDMFWTLPLLAMGITGYMATRNVYISLIGLLLLLGYALQKLQKLSRGPLFLLLWVPVFSVAIIFYSYLLTIKHTEVTTGKLYFPVQAAEFAKNNLKGNMFNDYTYGGYMLYAVYPKLHVFIDGRADLYLCCEMGDYMKLALYKYQPDREYRQFINNYMTHYHINFAIIATEKHRVMRRIAEILNTDPHWALIYWDDYSQIFVKRDGVNDQILSQYEAKYATPYLRNPYRAENTDEAYQEYLRMDSVTKSAHTSNTIGYIMAQKGDLEGARKRFMEAIELDPTFESSYMNLAELNAHEGKLEEAIRLYILARKYAPDRGLIYIRLGQLVIDSRGDVNDAKHVWQNGIKNTVDTQAKKTLEQLLKEY